MPSIGKRHSRVCAHACLVPRYLELNLVASNRQSVQKTPFWLPSRIEGRGEPRPYKGRRSYWAF